MEALHEATSNPQKFSARIGKANPVFICCCGMVLLPLDVASYVASLTRATRSRFVSWCSRSRWV